MVTWVPFDDSETAQPSEHKIEIDYKSAEAQGINVRTEPVNDISVDDLQSADTLLNRVSP